MSVDTVTSYIPHLPTPLAVALCALPVVYAYTSSKQKKALPPGPKPLPLIGNVLDVPKEAAWKVFKEWGHEYGVYYPTLFYSIPIFLGLRLWVTDEVVLD